MIKSKKVNKNLQYSIKISIISARVVIIRVFELLKCCHFFVFKMRGWFSGRTRPCQG